MYLPNSSKDEIITGDLMSGLQNLIIACSEVNMVRSCTRQHSDALSPPPMLENSFFLLATASFTDMGSGSFFANSISTYGFCMYPTTNCRSIPSACSLCMCV